MLRPTRSFGANPYRSTPWLQLVIIPRRSVVKTASCNWSRMPGGMMTAPAGPEPGRDRLPLAGFCALSVGGVFGEIGISLSWAKRGLLPCTATTGPTNSRYRLPAIADTHPSRCCHNHHHFMGSFTPAPNTEVTASHPLLQSRRLNSPLARDACQPPHLQLPQ